MHDLVQFPAARHVFAIRDKKDEHNKRSLKTKKEPVVRVNAKHDNQTAENGCEDEAQGREVIALFSRGARVMFTVNLWTQMGLVIGTTGKL